MRNVGLVMIALALGTTPALAQSTDWANKAFKHKGGSVTHDFGGVPRGAQLYFRFPMTNIWQIPVEIMTVRTSCGCVTATTANQVLKPLESGFIDVTMDARRFTGPKTVSIYVTLGPEYTSTATLQVSANSRADVVFNPGQVTFGIVSAGQTPSQVIDVEYAGNLDWRVTEVIKNEAPLDVTLEELYRRPGQVGYRVRATIKADAPAGTHKWELNLKTNDPASPHVAALVEATIQASLTVVPGVLALQNLKVGETLTQRVVVRGNKPFKITAIDGVDADLTAELPTTAAAVHVLTIKCKPSQAGELRRQLLIKTDLGAEAPVALTVTGNAMP